MRQSLSYILRFFRTELRIFVFLKRIPYSLTLIYHKRININAFARVIISTDVPCYCVVQNSESVTEKVSFSELSENTTLFYQRFDVVQDYRPI